MQSIHPRAATVTPLEARRVLVVFTDHSSAEIDLAPLLRGPVFETILHDDAAFAQVRIADIGGCLEWPGGIDLDPEVLYELAQAANASASG